MLSFEAVDVFAARAYAGNPLAVVHGAADLDDAQLQAVARGFNLSETVFPLAPTRAGATYRARIFTPLRELPFAGHPSAGVAWALVRAGLIPSGDIVQECGAGLLPVRVDEQGARVQGGRPWVGARLNAVELAESIGLAAHDVDPDVTAGLAAAGLEFPILPVLPGSVSRAYSPAELPAAVAVTGQLLVMAFDGARRQVHARVFAPGGGMAEDPATGSAAVALAVFLVDRGLLPPDGTAAFTVHQGAEIGRPSRLEVEVSARDGSAERTSVGGRVFPVSSGRIVVPDPVEAAHPLR
jgi:trans-2,3-dihydro-3-hydroxyanthranilate isomerase